ncbi:MAG: hypothetical protein KVP17_002695 [Porospora cf. gigantea B]|uniref:uncharacterized protein n=1 Tax=Porospora cf. gigantea B TaxID=2853592 RepID=UPI003571AE96|nr:MAG: hypothetical protein KVP17_002695 [Porospora cf. gigantea B]
MPWDFQPEELPRKRAASLAQHLSEMRRLREVESAAAEKEDCELRALKSSSRLLADADRKVFDLSMLPKGDLLILGDLAPALKEARRFWREQQHQQRELKRVMEFLPDQRRELGHQLATLMCYYQAAPRPARSGSSVARLMENVDSTSLLLVSVPCKFSVARVSFEIDNLTRLHDAIRKLLPTIEWLAGECFWACLDTRGPLLTFSLSHTTRDKLGAVHTSAS